MRDEDKSKAQLIEELNALRRRVLALQASDSETIDFKNMLLEAQSEVSIDGILIMDKSKQTFSYNSRFIEMWNVTEDVLETYTYEQRLEFAVKQLKDPDEFLSKVEYLHQHVDEHSRDEIEFKDGRVFDRYSAPSFDAAGPLRLVCFR